MMQPTGEDRREIYIALELEGESRDILQSLTTEVMRWSETIWLMDLSIFCTYWSRQAQKGNTTFLAVWRKLFNHLLGTDVNPDNPKVISLSPSYRACCAGHPWTAILLLHSMQEKGVKGLISQGSKSGQSLLGDLSWNSWWQAIACLENHFQERKTRGFKQAGFKRQCKRLRLAVPRLGFRKPWDMHILNRAGMKRRFGEYLSLIWGWTFDHLSRKSREETVFQTGFPWKTRIFESPPEVRRTLDYSLSVWEQFVPLLIEDLDRLWGLNRNSGESVTRIDWFLMLDDMAKLTVPIRFRNPHNLRSEKGEHTTPLLQAGYGFAEVMNRNYPQHEQADSYYSVPQVVGWRLTITASLRLPDIMLDIFGEAQGKETDIDLLLQLENELPVPLNRFSPRGDWLPEDSFSEEHFEDEEVHCPESEMQRSLEVIAQERPLYIQRRPLPVEEIKLSSKRTFLESTMNKWWKEDASRTVERNYFKYIDQQGNALWVFRDTSGRWYQHGIFG